MRRPRAGVVMLALLVACGANPSPTPSARPSAEPPVADGELDLDSIGWWRVGFQAGNENPPHDQLIVGWLNGEVILRLPYEGIAFGAGGLPNAWVRGPAGGQIVYAQAARNGGGEFRLVDLQSAEVSLLLRLPFIPADFLLSPDGRDLYFAHYDRRVGTAVWRVSLEDPGSPQQVLAPSLFDDGLAGGDVILAARAVFHAQLRVSVDGTRLALFECGIRCRVTVVKLATGEAVRAGGDDWALWDECLAREGDDGGVCEGFQARDESVELQANFSFGVELPEPWRLELEAVPDAPQMSFELRAVAVNGDERIVLEALGIFSGQG